MCAEKIPTLSYMMPYFDEVLDVLEQKERSYRKERLSNEDADTLADGIGAAVQKIFKYFEVASDYAILANIQTTLSFEHKLFLFHQIKTLTHGPFKQHN
jgi:hypothetical protein